MRRLYYLADDLETTRRVSDTLLGEGLPNWRFHVLSQDEAGLYRYQIHAASLLQQLDVIHTGERWALVGGLIGLALGLLAFVTEALPWGASPWMVLIVTLIGALFGAWQGGMVGMSRENYKIERFHQDIADGRYLIMVDVGQDHRARVREIMNMGFPEVRYCGKDSPLVNPFKRPRHIYAQTTH